MPENPRKHRVYPITFDNPEDRAFYLAYAKRVHNLPLALLLKKWLADDRATREPNGPPKAE